MAYDARAVANYFVQRAEAQGKPLTPIQAIKLVYFAHGWCLGLYERPLIDDEVEAWDYGPVVRPVYDAFKRFGNQPITELAKETRFLEPGASRRDVSANFSDEDRTLLDKIWATYGKFKGFQLSNLTHLPGTPWDVIYKEHGQNAIIPDELIAEYFRKEARTNASKKAKPAGLGAA